MFLERKKDKAQHRFDERYYHINNRIKTKSWDIMYVVLLIAFLVVIIFAGISFSFFLVTALVVIRGITQAVVGIYYSGKD